MDIFRERERENENTQKHAKPKLSRSAPRYLKAHVIFGPVAPPPSATKLALHLQVLVLVGVARGLKD